MKYTPVPSGVDVIPASRSASLGENGQGTGLYHATKGLSSAIEAGYRARRFNPDWVLLDHLMQFQMCATLSEVK